MPFTNKKNLIKKNMNYNRKYKNKLLLYRKTIINQKGGVYESEHEIMARVMPIIDNHPYIKKLIEKIFTGDNIKYFKLDGAIPDPFIKLADIDDFSPLFYLDWYKSKNPSFKTHKELQDSGTIFNTKLGFDGTGDSIYETTIAQICRDICIMLGTGNRNMNNNARDPKAFFQRIINRKITRNNGEKRRSTAKEALALLNKLPQTENNKLKIKSAKNSLGLQTNNNLVLENKDKIDSLILLLAECDTCIKKGYIYIDVFEIIMNYITWLSMRTKIDEDFMIIKQELIKKYKERLMKTPAILFPTYFQISYKYVLCLISAPIINFRLNNRKRSTHGLFVSPIHDFIHDVLAHALNTHLKSMQINESPEIYKSWNNYISNVIDILYLYFNYKKMNLKEIKELGSKKYNELDDEHKKQIIAILLFIFIHENNSKPRFLFYHLFYKTDFTKIIRNDDILIQQPTTIENIYKYIATVDEWPGNIDVASVVAALRSIFDKHRKEFLKPMSELVKLIGLNLPII